MNTLAHTHAHAPASVRFVVFPPEIPTFFFLVRFVQAVLLVKVEVLPPLLFCFLIKCTYYIYFVI